LGLSRLPGSRSGARTRLGLLSRLLSWTWEGVQLPVLVDHDRAFLLTGLLSRLLTWLLTRSLSGTRRDRNHLSRVVRGLFGLRISWLGLLILVRLILHQHDRRSSVRLRREGLRCTQASSGESCACQRQTCQSIDEAFHCAIVDTLS
jgi:hypothetical protein